MHSHQQCFSIASPTELIAKLLNFCYSDDFEMISQSSFNYTSLIINEDKYIVICLKDILHFSFYELSVQDMFWKISEHWVRSAFIPTHGWWETTDKPLMNQTSEIRMSVGLYIPRDSGNPIPITSSSWQLQMFLGLRLCLSDFCLCFYITFYSSLCLSDLPLPLSNKDFCDGI